MSEKPVDKKGPSKRKFIQGLAASAAMFAIGGARVAYAEDGAEYPVDSKIRYDIIVIGGGTAGVPLAIHGAKRGAKVLVIEKAPQIGGTLFLAGGNMSAAGTRLQARKGIADDPNQFFADVMRLCHYQANPPVMRRFVDNAAAAVDWLEELGMTLPPSDPVKGTGHADFNIPRYISPIGSGRALVARMLPEFLKAEAGGNLRVLMNTGAKELIQSRDKRVTGVIVESADGVRTQYNGRSIVLASGGCLMNKELFEKYNGKPLYSLRVYPFSNGDGLVMGVKAGGYVSGGEKFVAHRGVILSDRNFPSPAFTNIGHELNPRFRLPWEIEVNTLGRRYVAEDSDIDTLERAQTNQPGMACWLVWDQEIYDKAPPLFVKLNKDQQQKAFESHPMFAKAGSLEELAEKMRVSSASLLETVIAYNQSVETKSDPLGRSHMPLPVAKGPFYAVQCLGSAIFGWAGIDIDGDMRVLTKEGRPIPGLYAVGEVAGGWQTHGDVVVNGGTITPAVALGRYLGLTLPATI